MAITFPNIPEAFTVTGWEHLLPHPETAKGRSCFSWTASISSPWWGSGNKACTGDFSEAAASPGPSEFLCLSLPRTGEPDEEEGTFRSSIRREFGDTAGGLWDSCFQEPFFLVSDSP